MVVIREQSHRVSGFSMLEMMISLAMFLVVSGAVLGLIAAHQKRYQSLEMKSQLGQSMRATMEMVAQDVGQAGSVGILAASGSEVGGVANQGTLLGSGLVTGSAITLGSAVNSSASSQTVNANGGGYFFTGEQIFVDVGALQEEITLTAASSAIVTGVFKNSHLAGAPIFAVGTFLDGIRTPMPATNTVGTAGTGYFSDRLDVYGDMHGNGTLTEVVYYCDPTKNQLTRQEITYPNAATVYTPAILLNNVVNCASTAGSGVFSYTASPGFSMFPSVSMTLTAQSATLSLETRQYITLTKTLLNVLPRNVLSGYARVNGGDTTEQQPDPLAASYPYGQLQPLLGQ
jgi:Tfp pilus assembly protein PilW